MPWMRVEIRRPSDPAGGDQEAGEGLRALGRRVVVMAGYVPEVERGEAASVIAHRQAEDRAASRRLDPSVVGMIAILSPHHEIRTHAATIPFLFQELRDPRVHTVINSYDVVGGRHTVAVVYNTEKWKSENPKSYQAVADALTEAMEWIAANKREAAELYVRIEKTQLTADDVYGYLQQEDKVLYSPTPSRMMVHAEFMHKIGSLKNMPESWKDLFFENVHDRPGS